VDETAITLAVTATSLVALVLAQVALRARRQRRDELALADNIERGATTPASLHPVIDTDRCIGSLACLKACPEGDILGIIDGAARLVHATNCVGHGRCAAACPVGAIQLVFGTATRGVDLPEVSGRFESSRPGVHLVGELGGMGLISNAIEQGVQCAGYLADELMSRSAGPRSGDDVVVIGAGPAGVSSALELRRRGLSVRLLDKGRLGGGVASFPRQGLVTTGPISLPGIRPLRGARIGKAELIGWFEQALRGAGQAVEEGVEVTGLEGHDGAFTLQTGRGPVAARKVVVATGRRGSPRRLGVPGDQLPKVVPGLVDVEPYLGRRVLVVGGGDAAVEAASLLAERGGIEVTLVHRGPELIRASPVNQVHVFELARQGKLSLRLSTGLERIEADQVTLLKDGTATRLENDVVIACLGGEPPLALLSTLGVALKRPPGQDGGRRQAPVGLGSRMAGVRWSRLALLAAGAAVATLVAGLAWTGRSYYPLAAAARHGSPLHAALRPASSLGLTIGIAATAVMLTNFLYALRKRWSALSRVGNLSTWLDVHVLVGACSPLVIAFHAAFQSNNLLASLTYSALGIVVSTGLVGRYFRALSAGSATELADLLGQQARLEASLRPAIEAAPDRERLLPLLEAASARPAPAPLPVQLVRSLGRAVAFRVRLRLALRRVPRAGRATLRSGLARLQWLVAQASVFDGMRSLMRAWRSLHASLAILLVVALTAHIGLAVYLGYRPGFR
jgi:thioredoxin reductase/NAD-dependent dihydropyrimidine dehydrogenase PreA subunit